MTERGVQRCVVACLIVLAGVVQITGITWGLPSRRADRFLFGRATPWTGAQIAQSAGERSGELAADVDADPVARSSDPVLLNDSDVRRAQIIRRYRLFTYQPDEMITLMSIAGMKPGQGDLDPKLYQYGGLWIYPVGAMLKIAHGVGYIDLAQPMTSYLDHPEAFGRFYVVMRLYVVIWALVGAWAVFAIARNAKAATLGAAGATLLYIFLPVVVNMSHEAKPHLPGAVLMLLAAIAAGRFVRDGKLSFAILAGALCGAAMGMILTGAIAWAMLPAMVLLRRDRWGRRMGIAAAAIGVAVCVYFATNPYVLVHLAGDDAILRSNLGNSKAMYEVARVGEGLINAMKLLGEGATLLVAIVGLLGCLICSRRERPALALLSIVSAIVLIQFVLLAAGKPAEYGRFAILPAIVLAIYSGVLIGSARLRRFEQIQSIGLMSLITIFCGGVYLLSFMNDTRPQTRRLRDAQTLQRLHDIGARTIGVYDEPAPYLLPPVNLFEWSILLLPRGFDPVSAQPCDVIVKPVDVLKTEPTRWGGYVRINDRTISDVFPARISWANKAMEIWVRKELLRTNE